MGWGMLPLELDNHLIKVCRKAARTELILFAFTLYHYYLQSSSATTFTWAVLLVIAYAVYFHL